MIWRSWVQIPAEVNLGCKVFLSRSYLNCNILKSCPVKSFSSSRSITGLDFTLVLFYENFSPPMYRGALVRRYTSYMCKQASSKNIWRYLHLYPIFMNGHSGCYFTISRPCRLCLQCYHQLRYHGFIYYTSFINLQRSKISQWNDNKQRSNS